MSLILGINGAYHEGCAVIVRDGQVRFAVEEERLSRLKHAKAARVDNSGELPWRAIAACLRAEDATLAEVDAVGFSLVPGLRGETVAADARDGYALLDPAGFGSETGERRFDEGVRSVPEALTLGAPQLGVAPAPGLAERVAFLPHHRCHAASAFFGGPFERAALLVVDGIGERDTAWLGVGSGATMERLEAVRYPCSIGMVWEQLARYLGFGAYDAGKAMGLAAYGDPERFAEAAGRLLAVPDSAGGAPGSQAPPFVVDGALARLRGDLGGFAELFGPPRDGAADTAELPGTRYADVAAAVQRQTERALLATARRLARASGELRLVYAGGVALNCVANARLEREGPFEAVYIPGAAHDAGTALGAALDLAARRDEVRSRSGGPLGAALGPAYDGAAIDAACVRAGVRSRVVAQPWREAAERVAAGQIVGWFSGRLELGPRALGQRSLLADPRQADARERLNARVKHRERFRPFAASLLEEQLEAWFELPTGREGAASSRELMLLAYPLRAELRARVPAVVHVDGTCRLQTVSAARQPRYHALIARFFELSGVPLLLNTSFNDREPIVCSPDDALATFGSTDIDCLLLEDRLVER